jgi:dephospho-CoA kinase
MRIEEAVAVCGRTCSGKSSLVQFLSKRHSFETVSFGRCIRSEVSRRGLPDTRPALQETGYELFTTLGPAGLLELAVNTAQLRDGQRVVFDGVRDRSVLAEMRRICKRLHVVYVEAEEGIRYARYRLRGETGSGISLEEFRTMERHPIERGIDQLAEEAEITLETSELSPAVYDHLIDILRSKRIAL